MCLMALWHFHFFANPCLPFNITPSVKTFTQRANAGTNITLLSICDLPALCPPSEGSPTMEKGEGGSTLRYSVIHCRCTGSRTGDSIQYRQRKSEKIHSVCSAQEIWDGKDSSLLHQMEKENFDKWRMQTSCEPSDSVYGRRKIDPLSLSLSGKIPRPWATSPDPTQATRAAESRIPPKSLNTLAFSLCSSRRRAERCTARHQVLMQPRRAEKQVSVIEQSFCPAHFIAQNMHLGHSFPPAALWETYQSFVPCSSHPVWHNSCWFLHFLRFRQNLASETGQCEMEV